MIMYGVVDAMTGLQVFTVVQVGLFVCILILIRFVKYILLLRPLSRQEFEQLFHIFILLVK